MSHTCIPCLTHAPFSGTTAGSTIQSAVDQINVQQLDSCDRLLHVFQSLILVKLKKVTRALLPICLSKSCCWHRAFSEQHV